MKEIIDYVKARYLSEKAQGIVEYALILAFIAIVAVAVANGGDLQIKVKKAFDDVSGMFDKKA